uniref:Cytochrome P450 n=1 Tax=Eutreptiella gymnastica TaxID=73025 RepID=A0A7S1I6B7_9EUGL|mmetsp:Transcript_133573/g.231646  ORF Transcript_133573/g.231646 Transcript_133573/m.231646 type:complete len:500 (+) Transcript_133573:24-1523(+)
MPPLLLLCVEALGVGFLVLSAYYILHVLFATLRMRWKCDVPMVSGGLPLFGQALTLATHTPWDVMQTWYENKGSPVRFTVFNKQMVVIADPADLKSVWQTNLKAYSKDRDFAYGPFLPLLGSGLVTSEGELWKKQRLMVSCVFRVEILDEIVGMAKRAVDRLCTTLDQYKGTGNPIDIEVHFRNLTLQVIGEALLSMSHEEADRVFPELYLPIMEEANRRVLQPWRKFLPTPTNWAFERRVKELNKYIIGLLRARRDKRAQEVASSGKVAPDRRVDILDRILDQLGDDWGPEQETQLCYEFKTFVLAGHETSAAMLCWSLYELTQNPEILKKVRAEATAIGLQKGPVDDLALDDHVRNKGALEYTVSVLKEALRKYSVVPAVTRTAMEDTELGGYRIPKDTTIVLLMQLTHRLDKHWPEPDTFRPERFSAPLPDAYQFVPFIGGPRNCLGQHLALLEARVVLAQLAAEYKFTPVHKDAGAKHPWLVPICPANGMLMYVE